MVRTGPRGMQVVGALLLVSALGSLIRPGDAAAAPLVSCHCFKDREYDPANPGKTDVYLLATTANTFLAAAYGFPKADVVRSRMSGVSGEDLWIAAYAAARLGAGREDLVERRKRAGSWKAALTALRSPLEPLGPAFVASLAGGGGDEALARIAAGRTLVDHLNADRMDLEELYRRGASVQETILAGFLARWSQRPAPVVYGEVRSGRATWSGLLKGVGRVPTQMENAITRELRPAGGQP